MCSEVDTPARILRPKGMFDYKWLPVNKADRRAVGLADRHYSRQTPGSREIGPPGQKIILMTQDCRALWGSHRPAPWSGVKRADGFEGHTCFIFRNEGKELSSGLIREAVGLTRDMWGVADFMTYVSAEKVKSINPGYCFLRAGFEPDGWIEGKHGRMRRLVMASSEVEHCAQKA